MFDASRRAAARGLRRASRALDRLAGRVHAPRWRPSAEDLALVAQNAELRNHHAGRRAFVIGNGPSLRTHDLRPLASEVTFVANGFWRHPLMAAAERTSRAPWQPTFYTIIDPLYFDGSAALAACFETIRRRTPEVVFFVPARKLPVIREQGLLPMERVRPCIFRGTVVRDDPLPGDFSRPLPHLQSVSLMGLLGALYTGCDPIYLIGMDHDWLSRPIIRCNHFYREVSVAGHPTFQAIEREGSETYLDNLEGMSTLYRMYYKVADLAAALGVRILNASRGGYLDVFARADYEDVVPQAVGPEAEDTARAVRV